MLALHVPQISIHAPVKGATDVAGDIGLWGGISIHAPVKGATRPHTTNSHPATDFNPRSREGSDRRQPG